MILNQNTKNSKGLSDIFIWPMLLTQTTPFSSSDFIYEWKSDGIRLELIHEKGTGIKCFTRHKTNCTKQFPELQEITLYEDLVLDGELIVYDPQKKKEDLELAMQRFKLSSSLKIQQAVLELPCTYIVFDVLYHKKPIMHLPLMERKQILSEVISPSKYVQPVMFIESEGETFFKKIEEMKLEGAVAKKKNSVYSPGKRSLDWKKIIRYEYYEVAITAKRKKPFGFLCSYLTPTGLKPAGVIEFASKPLLKDLYIKSEIKNEDLLNVYYKHPIRCKIKTRGLTRNGYLRTPVLTEVLNIIK
ncbi:ATP-dependent DNA ligase [Cytobacillus firmus]|uniref:ATP-dependent DNA ligase n=1 Tax=Cytobacillus firmus TaxID=1399 RepID=UPI00237C2AE0|nr:ATP-dependent DNA ligase [Cytobacillus firmus]MDD9309791.1 ATP-dependent DNA ligase [Cytobacillus firmus]